MAVMKTPGVYIVEKNAFPNSIVEVATAVPAFIGYTEKAENSGTSLTGKAWRISTMEQFERYFGGAPQPVFRVQRVDKDQAAANATAQATLDAKVAELASLKKAADALPDSDPGKAEANTKVEDADKALAALKDPTLALQKAVDEAKTKKTAADTTAATATPAVDGYSDYLAALKDPTKQEALDAAKAKLQTSDAGKAVLSTTDALATAQLKFDEAAAQAAADALTARAATGPLVASTVIATTAQPNQTATFNLKGRDYVLSRDSGKSGGRYLMHQAMRHFFQNGGGACYVVSVGSYNDVKGIAAGGEDGGLIGGLKPLLKEQEPTMVVVPDAVLLNYSDCQMVQQEVLKHCGYVMKNRFAILDVWSGELDDTYRSDSDTSVDLFRNAVGNNFLKYGAAYYPWVQTSLVQESEVDYRVLDPDYRGVLGFLIAEELKLASAPASDSKRTAMMKQMLDDMGNDAPTWKGKFAAHIQDPKSNVQNKNEALANLEDPDKLQAQIDTFVDQQHNTFKRYSELYPKVLDEVRRLINLIPPAAAMAGVYTMVDNTRGVWKAPANVTLAAVEKPAVDITHDDQENLNVHVTGKSINAIRSFVGEGTVVWGARTLDGNSLDWRYINVRRTMIMLEESCRLAAKAMVFEPNVANTWVTIKSMIANFLTGIWKRGGLMGAVPEDAFQVQCGLNETMTPEDILEGILRVRVLVCMVRPAEFIEITFQQQMPKS